MDRAAGNEADIQAPQPQAGEQARVPRADEDQGWPEGAEPAEAARPGAAHGRDRRQVAAESPRSRSERLPRSARIRRSSEIRRVLRDGKRRSTPNLDVFVADAQSARSRLGLIVPKLGRRIVDRNLLKRRLREIGRREVLVGLEARGTQADVLIRARGSAYRLGYDTLAREVREALEGLCSGES